MIRRTSPTTVVCKKPYSVKSSILELEDVSSGQMEYVTYLTRFFTYPT